MGAGGEAGGTGIRRRRLTLAAAAVWVVGLGRWCQAAVWLAGRWS